MIVADSLYKFVEFVANQYQSGRISPDEFNTAWVRAETEYINSIFGVGRNTTTSTGATDAERDTMRVLRTAAILSNNKYGWMPLPNNYFRWGSLYLVHGIETGKVATLLSDDQWASRSDSKLSPPGKFTIAKLEGNGIIAKPVSSRFSLSYIRIPVTPVWAYTLDGNGRPVHDAVSSTNSELPEYLTNEIAFRICSYLGINISKVELVQYSEMKTQ